MTLLSTVLYPALLVAAGAVGYNLVDDSSAPQENVPPRVEVKKSVDDKIEVTVNGQRINVKPGQPLEIKIKSNGDERVIRLPLSGSGQFQMLAPHGDMDFHKFHELDAKHFESLKDHFKELKFDFDEKEFAKLGDSFKELKFKFDNDKDLAKLGDEMKGFKLEFDEKDLAKLDRLKLKLDDRELKDLYRADGKELKLKAKAFRGRDLASTLTADQKKKMKAQGYLLPADLTPAQREMLPQGKGEWKISISIDGESYNFQSK